MLLLLLLLLLLLFWLLSSPSSLSSSAIKYSYLYLCQCNCSPLEGDPILRWPVPRLNPAPDHLHLGPPGVSRQHGLACSTGFQFASCSALRANFAIKYPPLHCTVAKGTFQGVSKNQNKGKLKGLLWFGREIHSQEWCPEDGQIWNEMRLS